MKLFNKTKTYYLWLDSLRCFLLTLVISFFLYITAINLPFFDPFQKAFQELDFTDIYYAKDMFENKNTDKIILVNIGESDRCGIADMIQKISSQDPKVIGLDIFFKGQKDAYCDSLLLASLQSTSNIISSYSYDNHKQLKNNSNYFSIEGQKQGYVTSDIYNDTEIVRDFIGVKQDKISDYHFSFPVQVALEAKYIDESTAMSKFKDETRINYFGRSENFLSFQPENFQTEKPIPTFKDAVVLIGYLGSTNINVNNIEDKHYSPLNKKIIGRSRPDMHGLTIHANIIKMLESGKYIFKLPKLVVYVLAFLISFFLIMLGLKLSKNKPFLYDLGFKLIVFVFTVLFSFLALWLVRLNTQINITLILVYIVLGVETIGLYKHIINYAKKRFGWKSYI